MKHHLCPPELNLTTILFGLAVFLCGCSSSYSVRSTAVRGAYTYGEMNKELEGRDVRIELKDGRVISAKKVKISDDSASWLNQRTDEESKASIRQLARIVMKNDFLGSLEGLGFGLLGGGGLGALVGNVLYRGGDRNFGSGLGALMGLVLGAVTGAVVGFNTGLIEGHTYNYEFPTTEQSDSLQNGKSRQE
ncbi:MAG: hypothetical protein Q8P51_07120 [Ignavibacteria bacterium]|nr:hypothetical protein [Ignavibacteria bacterium]